MKYSQVFIALLGGFGTLDELFGIDIDTNRKISRVPIILVGTGFWTPLKNWIRETNEDQFLIMCLIRILILCLLLMIRKKLSKSYMFFMKVTMLQDSDQI